MKKLLFFFTIIVCCLLISCTNRKGNENVKQYPKNNFRIGKSGLKSFHLDRTIPNISLCVQFYDDHSKKYFTFITDGKKNQNLLIYDYDTNSLVYKIDINSMIGGSVMGYTMHNLDSIFLYSYSRSQLFLITATGRLLKKYQLPAQNKLWSIYPNVWTGMNMVFKDNKLYMAGLPFGEPEDNTPIVAILDLKSDSFASAYRFPDSYQNRNWGGIHFRYIYFTYDSSSDNFLFSFPAEHFLFKTKDLVNSEKIYAGSQSVSTIYPMKMLGLSNNAIYKHFVENPSYRNVIHDPYNGFYYRFAEMPTKYNGGDLWDKPLSVVVL